MNADILLMFLVLFTTIILFVFEVFSIDRIAFFIIVTLILLGLVTPEEGVSGFSNSATIAVLSLMILTIAMENNGVIHWLTSSISKVKSLPIYLMAPIIMFVTAGISAFISTTAVVLVFIKIVNQLSEKYNIPQSKLLLPISFAGILGGSCTLMGTSTNLIVNSVAKNLGAEKIGFFEISTFGIIFLVVSIAFITLSLKWLPWDSKKCISADYELEDYITRVIINPGSPLIGKTIRESFLFENPNVSLLQIIRDNQMHHSPGKYITLKENDELLLMCNIENLEQIIKSDNLSVHTELRHDETEQTDEKNQSKNTNEEGQPVFVELLMLPGAVLLGKTLGELRRYMLQGAIPLAIKKRKTIVNTKERMIRSSTSQLVLKEGDRLLVEISREQLPALQFLENVILLQEFDTNTQISNTRKYYSLGVLILVVLLAAIGIFSIMVSALIGVSLLLLSKNLDLNTVYKKVNWQVFFLLAGMIPLGAAMHNTGADKWISNHLLVFLGGQPSYIIIGTLFLVTMLLSGVVSNNATAIIMTPIAISVASGMNLDYKPFILTIMFASNFSFFTPMGYQTNTLIYGIGNYRFKHFLIIGGILSLILWLLATYLLTNML
ncbi:SLC13 family permease [Flavobacterium sp. UMI-01]|uniref:SLC13 family permease n=1 Tax=Flavobacterium sp. UMI-01 TaxID=1441053 RepID=UPI001C7D10FD|nr:SLC13 family permease [Flavobacterium sp. UMI-01]GIZ08188.1 membrane protein [Flavobacterium sp. UMI-01]